MRFIRSVLKKVLKDNGAEVYCFGSRARGKGRPDSDLDLLIKAASEIPLHTMALLREIFEESSLPFKVDVTDYHRISESFQKKVMREGKQL